MSNYIVYYCHCLNIRIHLSTKYANNNFEQQKAESIVNEPLPGGWEFDLGMGGIVIEYNSLVEIVNKEQDWKTTSCLNCNCGPVLSVKKHSSSNISRVVIHENAILGKEAEELKKDEHYSHVFNIKLNNAENPVPMPESSEDVPNKLTSDYQHIKSILDQSIEKIRAESKLRIEEFKKQQDIKTLELISRAKLENEQLWSEIVKIAKEDKKVESHVRFASVEEQPVEKTAKKIGFNLDESDISTSLTNKNLDYYKHQENEQLNDNDEDDEEDMFNLDEEFSEEEREEQDEEEQDEEEQVEKEDEQENEINESVDIPESRDQLLLSSSLKKSISEIDQKFSWIKKKRNTNKYLAQDFDIKSDFKRDITNEDEDTSAISMFATSVPITIHYPVVTEEEEQTEEKDTSKKNKEILASSFANYDFSYSDRLLSEQFPAAPRRRKSLAATSLIRPQLESLVGKSLDTRGLMKKKLNEIEPKDDDGFDSSLPPHVWAQMESVKDEQEE